MKRFHQALTGSPAARESGMSLIEIVIVMALMGSLMVVIVSTITKTSASAKVKETELAFGQLRSALQMYKMQVNHYPTTDLGLRALVEKPDNVRGWKGPYCEPELLKDAWGGEIQYESDGRAIAFHSAGEDEQIGTADDVSWPEPKEEASTH